MSSSPCRGVYVTPGRSVIHDVHPTDTPSRSLGRTRRTRRHRGPPAARGPRRHVERPQRRSTWVGSSRQDAWLVLAHRHPGSILCPSGGPSRSTRTMTVQARAVVIRAMEETRRSPQWIRRVVRDQVVESAWRPEWPIARPPRCRPLRGTLAEPCPLTEAQTLYVCCNARITVSGIYRPLHPDADGNACSGRAHAGQDSPEHPPSLLRCHFTHLPANREDRASPRHATGFSQRVCLPSLGVPPG
jgi:hypothetical protein